MKPPPLLLVFLAVLLLALGTTGGAAMSVLRPQIEAYATERIFADPETHYLSGMRAYDIDVVNDIVFRVEAGLSFFHTHAEAMGIVLLFASIVVASVVPGRRTRAAVQTLLGLSFLFPLGYLAYSGFILRFGRDAGVPLAERLVLIPFGSAGILGVGLLAGLIGVRLLAGRRARAAVGRPPKAGPSRGRGPEDAAPHWPRPSRAVVLAAALLIALAEISGATLGRFAPDVAAFVTALAEERPATHGLVGVPDVDDEILEEVRFTHEAGIRLFHLHAEGLGLLLFAGVLVTRAHVAAVPLRRGLDALLIVGSYVFCLGYLVWSALIPFVGLDAARAASARYVLVPGGALVLVALWVLTVLLARDLLAPAWRRWRARGGVAPGQPAEPSAKALDPGPGMRLPHHAVTLAALGLLAMAQAGGGAMVQFKLDLDLIHRQQAEAVPQVHGLVGVRAIDGPIIDEVLERADFALRLFHLHGAGMALVIFAGGVMVRSFLPPGLLAGMLQAMLAAGGFLYPFGYLAWSWLIPLVGLRPSRDLVELFVWAPFGGLALVAMALVAFVLASQTLVAPDRRRADR